jgi:hypothetical protein
MKITALERTDNLLHNFKHASQKESLKNTQLFYMTQTRTCISNVVVFLCSMSWCEWWLLVLLMLVELLSNAVQTFFYKIYHVCLKDNNFAVYFCSIIIFENSILYKI